MHRKTITATPWTISGPEFSEVISASIPHSQVYAGVFSFRAPSADGVLAAQGMSLSDVEFLLSGTDNPRSLLQRALSSGTATTGTLGACTHTLCAVSPEHLPTRTWWVAYVARGTSPFTPEEAATLHLQLRSWQASFNAPREPGLFHVITDRGWRPLHTNPSGEARLSSMRTLPEHFTEEVSAVRRQRWPTPDGRVHDIALDVGGAALWVRLQCRSPFGAESDSWSWFIEARPLEDGELPLIGTLADDRIARALAFLHDRYTESPGLQAVADEAHVSPFHFQRLFTKQIGVSPKQYLLQKQLQWARWRLRQGDGPISAVASGAGFANHAHFTSTFQRLVGESPTHYQRRHYPNASALF